MYIKVQQLLALNTIYMYMADSHSGMTATNKQPNHLHLFHMTMFEGRTWSIIVEFVHKED